nr:hypothetical protein [Tanacetum cinerariifolium]
MFKEDSFRDMRVMLERVKLQDQGGEGHIVKQCSAKKRVKDSKWFKHKMLLTQAQEARVVLNEDQQDFLTDRLEENDDCNDLQLHTTSNFKVDHVDAYDSDCDDEATASVITMDNLSPVGSLMITQLFHLMIQTYSLRHLITTLTIKLMCLIHMLKRRSQTVQTMYMLTKPQVFYDEAHKTALGYQNPLYLRQAQRKQHVLYNEKSLIEKHDPIYVCDSEETLILAKDSRLKMNEKQIKVKAKPIDYSKLNNLYEYFFHKNQLSAEQVYWAPVSKLSLPKSVTKVFPKKLPSTSEVHKNLQNARDLLNKFDDCIQKRTTLSPHEIGSWEATDIKGAFKQDVIPFFKKLRETFKHFEMGLHKEVSEMKSIFQQIKDKVN